MIRHMRHGSPPRLMALQSILSPNRRESLPTPSAGARISPERRRQAVIGIRERYGLSDATPAASSSQPRGTQRYVPTVRADEDALTRAIVTLASEYGRYAGFAMMAAVRHHANQLLPPKNE